MTTSKDTLLLFTANFPFEKNETHLESEIVFLSKAFKYILVFPYSESNNKRQYPSNVEVLSFNKEIVQGKFMIFVQNFFLICSILIEEFYYSNNKKSFFKHLKKFMSSLIKYLYIANHVKKEIINENWRNSICYSYWFDEWATILSILKLKKVIRSYVSRAHGFDLYYERWEDQIIPFRYLQLKMVNKVFPDSRSGETYMKSRGIFPEKISCSYYGVDNYCDNPMNEENFFRIVSCSNLIPLKRIHLIIEILKNLHFNVEWVHFGEGSLMKQLKEKCSLLPHNISVKFKGQTSNKDLLEYYKTISINLFITVSETEGLPMSLIEACSFGIPLMGTDVGGVSEIVNKNTGILIPKDFLPDEIAARIEQFRNSDMNSYDFRKKVKSFWDENFNAQKNYNTFINLIRSV